MSSCATRSEERAKEASVRSPHSWLLRRLLRMSSSIVLSTSLSTMLAAVSASSRPSSSATRTNEDFRAQ